MRDMKVGQQAFFYHSNCKEPGIAGIIQVSTAMQKMQKMPSAIQKKYMVLILLKMTSVIDVLDREGGLR